jgi:hypothetical protein
MFQENTIGLEAKIRTAVEEVKRSVYLNNEDAHYFCIQYKGTCIFYKTYQLNLCSTASSSGPLKKSVVVWNPNVQQSKLKLATGSFPERLIRIFTSSFF